MSGRSARGTRVYGGDGTSHSTTEAVGRARRRVPVPGFPFEGRFAAAPEVDAYLADEPLACLLCGHRFKMLPRHLLLAHGWSADAYRERYGIPYTCPLQVAALSAVQSATMAATRAAMGPDGRAAALAAARASTPVRRRALVPAAAAAVKAGQQKLVGRRRPDLTAATVATACTDCGAAFEAFRRTANRAVRRCPACKRARVTAAWKRYGAERVAKGLRRKGRPGRGD